MEHLGLSDDKVAGRIWVDGKEGVDRVTVTRWRKHQNRLNPEKIAALANALDITPEELWRPPPAQNPSQHRRDASEGP